MTRKIKERELLACVSHCESRITRGRERERREITRQASAERERRKRDLEGITIDERERKEDESMGETRETRLSSLRVDSHGAQLSLSFYFRA